MTKHTYMWAYIQEHPQETKRLIAEVLNVEKSPRKSSIIDSVKS